MLILTTRWNSLLQALRILHVPQAFVLISGMTDRYIYVLLHAMNDMFLARRSRLVGRVSGSEDRQWLTASIRTSTLTTARTAIRTTRCSTTPLCASSFL